MTAANRSDVFSPEFLGVRESTICTAGFLSFFTTSAVSTTSSGLTLRVKATGASLLGSMPILRSGALSIAHQREHLVGFVKLLEVARRKPTLAESTDLCDLAGKLERHPVDVILDDGCAGVFADVEGLIEGETNWNGVLYISLGQLVCRPLPTCLCRSCPFRGRHT